MFCIAFLSIWRVGLRTLSGTAPAAALFASVLLTSLAAPAASIYKWLDEKGVTHYSKSPPRTARQAP